VPVLIAAYDEPDIGTALRQLPADTLDVIVAVNGEPADGPTARAASPYGVQVITFEEPGKILAIQETLRGFHRFGHDPLDPVLFLDADSYPMWPRAWARVLTRLLTRDDGPAAAAGLVRYHGRGWVGNLARTSKKLADAVISRQRRTNVAFGANMALRLRHQSVLDGVLALPHIWRGEDRAMIDVVRQAGGRYVQCLSPLSLVAQSSRYSTTLKDRLLLGQEESQRRRDAAYNSRAAPGAVYYYDSARARLVPIPKDNVPTGRDRSRST
jgi:hypothetical protein